MKTRITALLLCFVVALGLMAGCSSEKPAAEPAAPASTAEPAPADAAEPAAPAGNYKVTLITMDQMDQHWVNVDKGCKEAVAELGNVDYNWLAPDVKDDAKQIECINNAVAGGAQAILLAANGPDAVTASLKEAEAAGVKIVYVDSAADYPGVATLATDNKAAGTTAGNEMIKALEAAGITEGKIGIVNVNAATASTVAREEASAPPLRAPSLRSSRPSTATATPRNPRISPRTTSPRAASASSARTRAPQSAPATPSRRPAAPSSASASTNPTRSSASSRTASCSAPWRRIRTSWAVKASRSPSRRSPERPSTRPTSTPAFRSSTKTPSNLPILSLRAVFRAQGNPSPDGRFPI